METNCKFYELDLEAQKEAEEMATLFPLGLTGDEEVAYIEYMREQKSVDDPFANCGICRSDGWCGYLWFLGCIRIPGCTGSISGSARYCFDYD